MERSKFHTFTQGMSSVIGHHRTIATAITDTSEECDLEKVSRYCVQMGSETQRGIDVTDSKVRPLPLGNRSP